MKGRHGDLSPSGVVENRDGTLVLIVPVAKLRQNFGAITSLLLSRKVDAIEVTAQKVTTMHILRPLSSSPPQQRLPVGEWSGAKKVGDK